MKAIIASLLLVVGFVNAQTYRFYYEMNFKIDSLAEKHTKELMVLDVNSKETKFYANDFIFVDSAYIANK